jgi:type IV secretion system protein VirB9
MRKVIIYSALAMLFLSETAFSVNKPNQMSRDIRIKSIVFHKNDVVPLKATTFTSTQIMFDSSESVLDIQNGDAAAWEVKVNPNLANMVFIKPTKFGSNTNLTVITDAHDYYFHLMSNNQPNARVDDQIYAMKFLYPIQEKQQKLEQLKMRNMMGSAIANAKLHPQKYNWSYSFNGDRRIVPLKIFDDGVFTYLEFGKHQVIPAIFSVMGLKGDESLVNFRRYHNWIIVESVAPQFSLRDGTDVVASIFNNPTIRKIGV